MMTKKLPNIEIQLLLYPLQIKSITHFNSKVNIPGLCNKIIYVVHSPTNALFIK